MKKILTPFTIGAGMAVIAPVLTQATGVDVTTGISLVKDIINGAHNHYSFVQWLQLAGQAIGYTLMTIGALSKKNEEQNKW